MSKSHPNLLKFFHPSNLIKRARHLIFHNKGYLYKSNVSLVKHELELFLAGKPNELKNFVVKMEKKLKKYRKEITNLQLKKARQRQDQILRICKENSLASLKIELSRAESEMIQCRNKWVALKNNNPADRTMRKATLSNKMDGLAKKIELLKDCIIFDQNS